MIGKTVSHYRIVEKLGEGGMGVVYKALDLKLERPVALKFLPPAYIVSPEDRARFLQEARAASAISHPNVCVIYDIAEYEGQQFIVMEFVDGKTLRQLVPIQKLHDAFGYAIQIGEALEEAHGKGVVHRDIKTDNIMVNAANQVKVMDFGLAKLRGSLKLTRTSSTVGTLSYMAPEQIQGGEVDARSDIFSFGVLLYEMLTGQLPFVGEHEAAMMYSILNESPQPIQKFRPELSSEVLHIINRALEKDPEDRYQTMRDMVIDLRRAKKETSRVSRAGIAPPVVEQGATAVLDEQMATRKYGAPAAGEQKAARRAVWRIGLIGILAAIAVIAVLRFEHKRPPSLNPDMSFRPLQVPFSEIESVGLSRDGSWLAFDVRDANDLCSVYFMNVAKGNPQRLTTEPYRQIFSTEISPDGSDVLYDGMVGANPSAVYIVSSLGGASRKIAEPGRYARWRPDGQFIGYIRDGTHRTPSESGKREFWTVKPDGSENRLEFIDSLSYVFGGIGFDWSPDGKSIAWLRSSPDFKEIFIRDLKSAAERQLTGFKMPIYEIAWASNNQIFFSFAKSGSTNIWMIPAQGGEAVQVTKGAGPDYGARVSGDSKRLLYVQTREIRHIWTAGIDGSNARQLTFDNQYLGAPSFSPDKRQISYYMASEDILHPTCHVFTMDSDGSNRTQVTSGDAGYFNAAWSPDGKYIAYGSYRMNEPIDSSRVYIIEASNPGTPRLIGKGINVLWINAEELIASTAPHRQSIRYALHKSGPLQISQDSTLEYPLHDEKHALVWDYRTGKRGWWVKRTAPGENEPPKLLVPEEYFISSSPSVSLKYLLSRQANAEVWRISLPDGRRERLPDFLNGRNPFYDEVQMSYDDEQLVYLTGQIDAKLVLIDNLFK